MKLIIAIVRDEDGNKSMMALNRKGFSVTKLATTGGFLRAGNMTMLVGTDEEKVDVVIDIIKNTCKERETVVTTPQAATTSGVFYPIEVAVGGATIFVVDVDRFERV